MAKTEYFFVQSAKPCHEASWQPAVDVYWSDHNWLVKCDLAGARRDEIEVSVTGSQLQIAGVRRDWSIVAGHRAYSMEIAYDRFARTIQLPCELDEKTLQVDYRDGMLLITISGRER